MIKIVLILALILQSGSPNHLTFNSTLNKVVFTGSIPMDSIPDNKLYALSKKSIVDNWFMMVEENIDHWNKNEVIFRENLNKKHLWTKQFFSCKNQNGRYLQVDFELNIFINKGVVRYQFYNLSFSNPDKSIMYKVEDIFSDQEFEYLINEANKELNNLVNSLENYVSDKKIIFDPNQHLRVIEIENKPKIKKPLKALAIKGSDFYL